MRLRRIIATAAIGAAMAVTTSVPSAQAATFANCEGAGIDPVGGSYTEVRSNCSVAGGRATKVTYRVWGDRDFSRQRAVVQVLGFENGRAIWHSLGTIAPGRTFVQTVPWGNNMAYPKIRITALEVGGALVAKIFFSH